LCCFANANAQTLSLDAVLTTIKTNNPQLKMYDADIQSMDAAAKGQKLMAPQINLFMTPYNVKMWKANEMNPEWVPICRLYANDSQRIKTKSRFKLHECDVSCRSRK
jgi:hypothetical protein